jgi:hypothetical protein
VTQPWQTPQAIAAALERMRSRPPGTGYGCAVCPKLAGVHMTYAQLNRHIRKAHWRKRSKRGLAVSN